MPLSRRLRDDSGMAMLTVVLVGAIMTAMGVAVTKTAIVNLDNAGRDRVASGALGAAEAGVAGAITYIRSSGVKQICNNATSCATPWNLASPKTITYQGGGQAVVTIKEIQKYAPPANRIGRYVIKSIGTAGSGPGRRTIEQAIDVRPFDFPLGVYTQAKINLGGNVNVTRESVFSGSCIDSRDKLSFIADPADGQFNDPYNDMPAGAHSASYITNRNESVCSSNLANVKATDTRAIHGASTCNSTWWADQDATPLGGPFTSATGGDFCRSRTTGKGDYDTKGSEFSLTTLRDVYGFVPRGLTDEQFALLKAKAKANGTWFPAGVTPVFPTASYDPGNPGFNPILYIEDQNVSITSQLGGYAWTSDPSCTGLHPSIIIVVERGNLNLGSSTSITGNLFVPDGEIAFSGGANLLGTMFSRDLKFVGSGNVGLNDCVAANTHGGILSITKTRFRELDH